MIPLVCDRYTSEYDHFTFSNTIWPLRFHPTSGLILWLLSRLCHIHFSQSCIHRFLETYNKISKTKNFQWVAFNQFLKVKVWRKVKTFLILAQCSGVGEDWRGGCCKNGKWLHPAEVIMRSSNNCDTLQHSFSSVFKQLCFHRHLNSVFRHRWLRPSQPSAAEAAIHTLDRKSC